ncbi:MAG: DNRLRE domain-containing protein [Nanoarchaeota archaeon]
MKMIILVIVACLLLLGTASAALITDIRQPDNNTGKDTHLRSIKPDMDFGASDSLDIKPDNDRNALFEFNLSSIPAQATVIVAELKLYVLSLGIGPDPIVYAHRINRSWTEGTGDGDVTNNGATWNTYNGTANWSTAGGDYDLTVWSSTTIVKPTVNVWYGWDVTELIKSWLNDTFSNYGLLIRTNTTSSGTSSFTSSDYSDAQYRPLLRINYTLPLTFTFASPTPDNGSTILTNFTVINISLTNGNATQAQLEWNGVNYSMDAGSSLPSTTWSLNKTSLANGVYTYKVYALDSGTGVDDISETRTLTVNACYENWIASYESCLPNDTKLKFYLDANLCGTYDNLPIDNGTYVACDYIISTEFGGTDFPAIDVTNISNLVLTTTYGKINFSETISIGRSLDLDQYADISNNLISLDSANLPELNKSAVLTLYNLTFINPTILKNSQSCEENTCTKISYTEGTLVFNVTSFSNYSAAEGMYCGDNSCNNGESCSFCSADCGSCPNENSGGGGGGSSRTGSTVTKEVAPKEAVSPASPARQTETQPSTLQPLPEKTSAKATSEEPVQTGKEEPLTNPKNWDEMAFEPPEDGPKTNTGKGFTLYQLPEKIKSSMLTGAAVKTLEELTDRVKKNINDIVVFMLVMFGAASATYLTLNGIDSDKCRKARASYKNRKKHSKRKI